MTVIPTNLRARVAPAALALSLAERRVQRAAALAALVGVTILLLALLVVPIVITGAGDYGQWLMASRPFRGLGVPAYRDISSLPPLALAIIATIWRVVGNPASAAALFDVLLLVALVAGLAGVAYACFRSALAALVAPLVALLVFDRYVELFAFGGILQLAADAASLGAVATLVAAEETDGRRWPWRAASALSLAVMALLHVGTTEAMLPVWGALAGLYALRTVSRRGLRGGLVASVREHLVTLVVLAPVGVYWLVELLPANRTYLANPAAAAYRDAGSFLTAMLNYRPNAVILGLGVAALAVGFVLEVRGRRFGPWTLVAAWAALSWAEFGTMLVLGVSTDYPRFATVLTPPLLLGAAGALAGVARALVGSQRTVRGWIPILAAGAFSVVILVPGAAARDANLQHYYAAPQAPNLAAATSAIDATLGPRTGAILTSVRAGKWLEGTTGRESLFSQPVRFADRPDEWQRSLDAEVLENAAAALASPAFLVEYQHAVSAGGFTSDADLVIAPNHQGEWDKALASIVRDTFVVDAAGRKHAGTDFAPAADAVQASNGTSASITTAWRDSTGFGMTRMVRVAASGTSMELVEQAAGQVTTRLYPADGNRITSIAASGSTAVLCFAPAGDEPPCLRLALADPSGSISAIGDGGVWVKGGTHGGLDLTITDLTAGAPITGLESLVPAQIAARYHLAGAILETPVHGYADQVARLQALGFAQTGSYGRYAVFTAVTRGSQAPVY